MNDAIKAIHDATGFNPPAVSTQARSVDLPSFLTRTGPASYTLTFSASFAETAMLCGAKVSWRYVTGIEAAAPRAGMNYGKGGLHIPLACRYSHMELSLAQVEEEAVKLIEAWFAANPQPALGSKGRPEWRTAARAIQNFKAYNVAYPAEDFEVLGVEEPFDVELGAFSVPGGYADSQDMGSGPSMIALPATVVTVRFRGIRDLRVKWHDQVWVLDHKTMSEWSDLVIDEGKCSFQFQGYGWVERLLARQAIALADNPDVISASVLPPAAGLPVGGVIGNYLISREPYANPDRKPTPRDLPRDQFERVPYPYSDAQLDEWHERAMGVARDIFRHWSEGEWPQHSTACAHWGKCEYYRLCWETDPAYRMAAAMSADYRPRTPSPFEDESNSRSRE